MSDIDHEDWAEPAIYWNFTPFNPPRLDRVPERVLLKNWQDMMLPVNDPGTYHILENGRVKVDPYFVEYEPALFPILEIFNRRGTPNEHDTRVATNVIQWLGTNIGNGYLHMAKRYADVQAFKDKAHLLAWADENIRNANYILRERLIGDFTAVAAGNVQKQTLRDVETLELVTLWLDQPAGRQFLDQYHQDTEKAWQAQKAIQPK